MSGFTVTVPAAEVEAVNAELDAMGHGPCFSVPLRDGEGGATHAGFHAWDDAKFRADIDALAQTYNLTITEDSEGELTQDKARNDFTAHCTANGLEWSDPTFWFENPVMIGDQRTYEGKTWVSLVDYNVWPIPIGWREVVEDGYPAWVQPTGAHDAYALGDRVTHNGQDWESTSPANVWTPGVFGWVVI